MNLSFVKCPRCKALRPNGEVAHTCVVVRSTVPDHEAAASWAEQIPKQATVSVNDENLSRAYLDLVAREQRAVELLREIGAWERMFDDPDARMVVTKIDAFLAERREV